MHAPDSTLFLILTLVFVGFLRPTHASRDVADTADKQKPVREEVVIFPEDNGLGNGENLTIRAAEHWCFNVTGKSYEVTQAKHRYCEVVLYPLPDCKGDEQGNTDYTGSHVFDNQKEAECQPPLEPAFFGLVVSQFKSASLNCTDNPNNGV